MTTTATRPHAPIQTRPHHAEHLRIDRGSIDDYRRLSAFHYRAKEPATYHRILRLIDDHAPGGPALAGVLVTSFPGMYGVCRPQAWPHRFVTRTDYRDLYHLNLLLRTISRVVIEPRYRGIGAAVRLVRAYLDDPATPLTEAVTAVGRWCPFFRSAGMTPHEVPRSPRDQKLALALHRAGIRPWQLLDIAAAARAVRAAEIRDALLAWTRRGGGGARRDRARSPLDQALLAGASLTARPIMYSHGR